VVPSPSPGWSDLLSSDVRALVSRQPIGEVQNSLRGVRGPMTGDPTPAPAAVLHDSANKQGS